MAEAGIGGTDEFVLLDDGFAADDGRWLFDQPQGIIECWRAENVAAGLAAIESAVERGLHAAGFFAYELGYVLEPKLAPLLPPNRTIPLFRVGVFAGARRLTATQTRRWLQERAHGTYAVGSLRPALDRGTYAAVFDRVKGFIAAGDVYQINLTFPLRFAFSGNPIALYRDLCRRQRVRHGALIGAGDLHVLSLSPELFVSMNGGKLLMRPMKGTAARAVTPKRDQERRAWLAGDEKSRAENLMIVDLVRNDLGRLARPGDLRVTDLFAVETFRSLHQMTSSIEASLSRPLPLAELLRAMFPCGSVTGAPKIRAMEIIRALEAVPRGVYTGAIGMIQPGGRILFNVAIRTLVLTPDGEGAMGVGSGVVFDSDATNEYDECLLKGRFLSDADPPFALIETLKWERNGGFTLLDRHLDRIAASAAYFAIPCDRAELHRQLAEVAANIDETPSRVRLLLEEDGAVTIAATALTPSPAVLRYAVSPRPSSSQDPFRYHKTTRRALYEAELARLGRGYGCEEVLFVNERGELTEGAWTNLFLRRGKRLLTPPVDAGLLDGTLRQELLATRPGEVIEAVLRPADLDDADGVFLGNSVRGLLPARPVAGI